MKLLFRATLPTYFFLALTVCAQTTVTPPKPKLAQIDPNKFALIINGASGDEDYAKQFNQWTTDLRDALTNRYGFDAAKMKVLARSPQDQALRSTAKMFAGPLPAEVRIATRQCVFVFFIGHGSSDGKESKFNLVGPDHRPPNMPRCFRHCRLDVVVINMSSAASLRKSLSAKGRFITATRNGQETNATHFPVSLSTP
jgi:hypothetical protein